MSSSWKGKVVLVTGGANGIGKAIVVGYAVLGATVYFVDVDQKTGKHLESDLKEKGLRANFMYCDVSKEGDVIKVINHLEKQEKAIQAIINNAGVSKFKPIEDLQFSEWESILHTNLSSVFLFSKYGSRMMTRYGSIVNIASTRALMSEPNSEAYAATKGGIVSLSHALAASFSGKNIRVNVISPGWIETGNYENLREIDHEQHLSKRVGRPEDILKACLYLTDPENDFINGENIVVDGGMTKKMIYES
ncbi:SDR family NAD(P)-dependent oxidoreductase [Evansella cellulosilytica]|uniref:Short-chain dehydrogenase/reductase SDR n=1 Tax=Evansella cellulosilytica (strain ATCC 21833 / DSM 2522 / FERM P-1141 / JCM 9156 / N-4) TaxID=649639 RepID=E6TYI6_EVAC2|nr:SDR family oxidoreductase [Evansella cellulosilytica]ADU30036.1 short-chain dehydrogenase/reductase SDR [Evansella cellulosilytica DSM 2522]